MRFERRNEDRIAEEELCLAFMLEEQGCVMAALLAAMAVCLGLMALSHGSVVTFGINVGCAVVVAGIAVCRGLRARAIRRVLIKSMEEENGTDS